VHAELILPVNQNMPTACMQTHVIAKDVLHSGVMPTAACSFVKAECRGDICSKQNPDTQVQTTDISCNPKNVSQVLFDGGMHTELGAVDVDIWFEFMHPNDKNSALSGESYLAILDAIWGVSVGIPCNNVSFREPTNAIFGKSMVFCRV